MVAPSQSVKRSNRLAWWAGGGYFFFSPKNQAYDAYDHYAESKAPPMEPFTSPIDIPIPLATF